MNPVIIEYVTCWIGTLAKFGECCDWVDWCMYMGGFCWWLWIIELCTNCMSYLLVLIHLVNLFDDNYFDNSNEVRTVYAYTCDVVNYLCEHMHCSWVICSCIHDWWWRILYPKFKTGVKSYIRCFCCIEGDDLEVIWYRMHLEESRTLHAFE